MLFIGKILFTLITLPLRLVFGGVRFVLGAIVKILILLFVILVCGYGALMYYGFLEFPWNYFA